MGTSRDAAFHSNEQFRAALQERELEDTADLETKLGRKYVQALVHV